MSSRHFEVLKLAWRGLFALFLAAASIARAQENQPYEASDRIFTVCEVLTNRLSVDGKLVRIRGRKYGTDEGQWFAGDDCPGVVTVEGHAWPTIIWLETASPDRDPRLRAHAVDFRFDFEGYMRLWPKYRRLARDVSDECVAWTFTGLFETREQFQKVTYANGTSTYIGFGHLGAAPAQLLAKSADEVTVIPNCKSKPSKK